MPIQGNWIDLIIIAVIFYFLVEGWRIGVWVVLADFFSFGLSLIVALRWYSFAATLLRTNFSLSHSVANALGFLVTAIISETILGFVFLRVIRQLPKKVADFRWGKVLALLPAFGEALILISFILTLALGFPISPVVKKDIAESKIGGAIVAQTSGIENRINDIFGGVIQDSLTYLTIKPKSTETIPLTVETEDLAIDQEAEQQMFNLVNTERQKAGVPLLSWAPNIVPVARGHATDMWKRKYFGHISPEGEDVGDRLAKEGITYQLAGENLALAPTTQTAHTGLMNSEGHRANILEKRFRKVGIGVIDNGYYGKMFVQVFTD